MATLAMAAAVSTIILLASKVIHFSGITSITTLRSELSSAAKAVYETTGTDAGEKLALELDRLVSRAFGLDLEEVAGQGNL